MPGVRAVFQRANIGKIFRSTFGPGFQGVTDERRPPFEDDVVRYYGQYVALAVADTFEAAKAAADAVRVTYAREEPNVATELAADDEPDVVTTSFGPRDRRQSQRGDADAAFAAAPVKLDQVYVTPAETHNPIELHATTAVWEGSTLTLYEGSQAVFNHRGVIAQMFGLPVENVRVVTRFLGSGFGGKLWPWTHSSLAAAAARQLGRPVQLVVSRKMMFQTVGHRARTQQRVRLGATAEGKLLSLQHDYVYHRSMLDAHHEDCGEATSFQYSVPNLRVRFGRARRHVGSACDMRGPGAVPGLYATESAMNELAAQLRIDPLRLRVMNEPKIDEGLGIPFSSRHQLECFELGAQKFGWSRRTPGVGSMTRDGLTLGWGMAGAAWIAARFPAEASVQLHDDGSARVACGTQDIGTGMYTILAQLASEKTGVPLGKVEVALGDTSLPAGPISGGSMATGSVVPAVFAAADEAIGALLAVATASPGSPFAGRRPEDLAFADGRVFVKADGAAGGVPFADVLRRANLRMVGGHGKSEATFGDPQAEVLDALVRLPLRRGHVAAGDRPAARQPGGERHGRGPHHQSARRAEPDRGRGRDGDRHGAAGAHHVRSRDRRADQQQPGRLRGGGERGRAADRGALRRLPRQGDQRARGPGDRRDRAGRHRRRHHRRGAPRDGRARAGAAGEDRAPASVT